MTSQVKVTVPTRLPSPQTPAHKLRCFQATHAFNRLATNSGFSLLSGSIAHQNDTELKKVLYWQMRYYHKGNKSGPIKCRDCIGRYWEGSSGSFHSPDTTRKLTWLLVALVFIGVSLYKHDWLNHCSCDWTQSPVTLHSPNIRLILWLKASTF